MRLPPQRLPSSSGTAPSLLRNRPGARREPYKFIITKPYNPYPTYNPYKTYPTYNPYKTMINENNNSILEESNLDNREREDKATVQDNRDNSKQREPPYAERGRHGRLPRNSKERLPNASKQSLTPSERKKKRSERISEGMKRFYRKERFRILSGEKPQSKLLSPFPEKMRKYMSDLCYKKGYFHIGKLHDGILYYDSETRRCRESEENGARRYGIKFVEAEENDTYPNTHPNTHHSPPEGRE